jgi:hypothetical protein
MATNLKVAIAAANTALNALATLCNSGYIDVYATSQPSTPETSSGGTALATMQFGATAFGSASGGVLTANAITAATIANTGTAVWFRATESDHSTPVYDGSVGVATAGTQWAQSTSYTLNQVIDVGSNVYQCTTAGTSASSGTGPSGTGSGITDGTAVWKYLGVVGDMGLAATSLVAGAQLSISSLTVTLPAY